MFTLLNPNTITVESVTSGHPDKMCDQISDAVLDELLRDDPESRVAVECFGGHGKLILGGEVTSKTKIDYTNIAKKTYSEIGYEDRLDIISNVVPQSMDISQGVDRGGAGDQGIMYGYATEETENKMPQIVNDVHSLTKGLDDLRNSSEIKWLLPDGKSQITMTKDHIDTILISCQHNDNVDPIQIKEEITEKLINTKIANLSEDTKILINPTGKFHQGGFNADTGLTGRKIMVDTYGGLTLHGGGCFSGKDPTKVDRSGAYMARFTAKNIVTNGHARECYVSVAYAIGRSEPLMLEIVDQDGNTVPDEIGKKYDFRPEAIIERLDLKKPIYKQTAVYGHFGHEGYPWEEIE